MVVWMVRVKVQRVEIGWLQRDLPAQWSLHSCLPQGQGYFGELEGGWVKPPSFSQVSYPILDMVEPEAHIPPALCSGSEECWIETSRYQCYSECSLLAELVLQDAGLPEAAEGACGCQLSPT